MTSRYGRLLLLASWRPSGCSTFEDIGKNAARGSLRSSAKCRVVRHIAEEVLHGLVLQLKVDLVSTQSISTEGIELMIEVPSFEYTPLRVAL